MAVYLICCLSKSGVTIVSVVAPISEWKNNVKSVRENKKKIKIERKTVCVSIYA